MDFYYIMRNVLFDGIGQTEVERLLPSIAGQITRYPKDATIFSAGEPFARFGLILEGSVRIEHVSMRGDIEILTIMEQGKTFGEASACSGRESDFAVDYVAEQDCEVLFLDAASIIHPPQDELYASRVKLAANLTALLARRYLELARRSFVMTNRTIRTKVLTYLSIAARAYGTNSFQIPYNREQLASYLGVDRSALSAELSRMQKDGLIRYHKSNFELL